MGNFWGGTGSSFFELMGDSVFFSSCSSFCGGLGVSYEVVWVCFLVGHIKGLFMCIQTCVFECVCTNSYGGSDWIRE